jgi:diacylglycerol kinase (ATP)
MNEKEKILFIINPISGGKKKEEFLSLLKTIPDKNKLDVVLSKTEYAGHASILAKEAVKAGIKKIIAVGGDGTINEIAKELINTETSLGIIPFGSGNGLARHLGIPIDTAKALSLLNHATVKKIDVGFLNAQAFFCTAGLGFDAHIGKVFAGIKGRGFMGYMKAIIREYFHYTSEEYEVEINGKKSRHRAFLVTAANAGQYGNNAYIAPTAIIDDGLLDLCIVKPFVVYKMPSMTYRVFKKSINKSRYTTTLHSKKFTVKRKNNGPYHIDGEPFEGGKVFTFEIKENALNVLVK